MSEERTDTRILTARAPPQDCLSALSLPKADCRADAIRACRLTGATTFTGLGVYALRQAQLQGTFQRVRPKGAPVIGGQVTAVIGLGMSPRSAAMSEVQSKLTQNQFAYRSGSVGLSCETRRMKRL